MAKNKGGRPTSYSEEKLAIAIDYLENFNEFEDVVPTVAGLALALDVVKSTVYLWASLEENEEFSDTLEKIQQAQEHRLVSKGLSGEFNSTITKLMLSNHGYSEKSMVEQHNYNHEDALDELD
tara:strand:+ start:547 stop:915 length:369 start_codon:yes stop_codon:yes gene_type:complete